MGSSTLDADVVDLTTHLSKRQRVLTKARWQADEGFAYSESDDEPEWTEAYLQDSNESSELDDRNLKSVGQEEGIARVLESYRGRVLTVDDETAFVELKNVEGEVFSGQYSSCKLADKNILRGDYFDCRTVARDNCVEVVIEKVATVPISEQEKAEIRDEIARNLEGLE